MRAGLANRQSLGAGLLRFISGGCLFVLAVVLVLAAIRQDVGLFNVFAIATFLAALTVEHLLGNELRGLIGIRKVGPY